MMAKTGKLEPSPQLLRLEKMAINTALPDSPYTDLIPAYSGYSTPRSSASMSRSTSSKLRSTIIRHHVSHPARNRSYVLSHVTCVHWDCGYDEFCRPYTWRGLVERMFIIICKACSSLMLFTHSSDCTELSNKAQYISAQAGSKRGKPQALVKSKAESSAPEDSPTGSRRALQRCLAGSHEIEVRWDIHPGRSPHTWLTTCS